MTVNLSKGQKVSLSKSNPSLNKVIIGLGWDPVKETVVKKGFFGKKVVESAGPDIDCDAFAVPMSGGRALSDKVLYFGRKNSLGGALIHTGDNLTGDGDGDDEQIIAMLQNIPSDVDKIAIAVNIYMGKDRGQTFGKIENAFVRIVNATNNEEMCKYNLSRNPDYDRYVTMYFGDLFRSDGGWEFKAVGEPSSALDIQSFVRNL